MKPLNLRSRVLFIFSVLFFCTILISGIFSVLTFYNMRKSVATYTLEKTVLLTAQLFSGKSIADIIKISESISNDSLRLTLISSNGVVLLDSQKDHGLMEDHSQRPEIIDAIKFNIGNSIRYSKTLNKYMVYTATTFYDASSNLIIVRISTGLPGLNSHIRPFIGLLVFVFIFMLILTIGISLYSNSIMMKPIHVLTYAGRRWSTGNLTYRIPDLHDADFSELSDTMNSMAMDLQNMLVRLKKLESMRKDFVANVSHELRTPITLIKGFTETLISDDTSQPEKVTDFLNIINNNADRMESIIKDLLTLSTLENTSNISDTFIPVEAGFTVQTCVALFKNKAHDKGISIITDTDIEIYALANPGLLETALSNLIDNAVKYALDSTDIFVKAYRQEDFTCFSVINTGNKIPDEHMNRLFERFYRIDKARSKSVGGTGLGLAIVKHIAIVHNGTCTCTSDNNSTIFTIYIPSYNKTSGKRQPLL